MTRAWKWIEISILVGCVVIAFAIAATSSAQSDQTDRDSDGRQSTAQSQRDSQDTSSEDRSSQQQSRQDQDWQSDRDQRDQDDQRDRQRQDRDQSARESGSDWDQRGEGRSTWSRDGSRRAPDMYDRQSRDQQRASEEGGLGVLVVDDEEQGVRVVRVFRGTPAEEMGLRNGDRITHVDGRRIDTARNFISRIRNMEPGEEVELDIVRNDDERSLTGELQARSEALPQGGQQSYGSRQTQYSDVRDERGYTSSQSSRGSDSALNRLYALERQLSQLQREIQQLRSSLEGRGDYRSGSGRETSVIYYQNQPRYDEGRYSTRQSRYEGPSRQGNWPGTDESPGGETGEDRLRPNPSQLNER